MRIAIKFAAITTISLLTSTQAFAQAATQDINLTATVAKYCKIAGAANPAALSKTVPINGTTNNVDTAAIPVTVTGIVCNTPADIVTSSQSGAVKGPANSNTAFQNLINYTAVAKLGTAATSTINTATIATAAGVETGSTGSTAAGYSGDLAVSITPAANTKPLVAGTYSDTLHITITPKP